MKTPLLLAAFVAALMLFAIPHQPQAAPLRDVPKHLMGHAVEQVGDYTTMTTSNGTETLAIDHAMISDSSGQYEVWVTVRRNSDNATKHWRFLVGAKHNGSTATLSSALLNVVNPWGDTLALLGTDVDVEADAAGFDINVTGLGSTDLTWYVNYDGRELTE